MDTRSPYEEMALTEESLRARNRNLPPLTPTCLIPYFLRSVGEVSPPAPYEYQSRKFSDYGRSWAHHLDDVRRWTHDIEHDVDLPLCERDVLAGNRLMCLDYICDHVVCPDLCLRTSSDTVLFESECHALLNRRFLLIPYEEDGIFVNIVYDRRTHTVSTFDGVRRGRRQRHDNAVRALRSLIERSGLPRIPFVETQMQSRNMMSGDELYNGYIALEGARVFLRENEAVCANWTDWTSSMVYGLRTVGLVTETQARVIWILVLKEASTAWG
ncbi:hypothetical protein F4776DRAFT_661481 [Hypoxylon sp. NC0597]|nr:hypothetical protein F4776DRAFT_661481 [Hypoxylon sp. NC0597]